ncbi:protein fuzzy homolog [Amphiura filiformis]|uniref:protein fuzzy homolog n=1 Tax=Amphiura filiformis TaxID=82378 RepID=UPI003B217FBF
MAVHLVCLTNDGGVPLFSRSKGDSKSLAFAEQGMLYGVQMFSQNHNITLQSTTTDEAKVVWRVFNQSVVLVILVADDGSPDVHLNTLLDNVFHAMVMLVGLDNLVNIRNVERLRKDLRICYNVIDNLLEGTTDLFGYLTETVDVLSCPENITLQEPLEAFVNSADSTFGCLHCNGRLVVATSKWWSLSGQEMMLLAMFIKSLPSNSSSDVPVYLPHASPKVPHRLLSFHLLPGVVVSVLCLATPTLAEAEAQLIEQCWRPHMDPLRACKQAPPQNVPKGTPIDTGILGYLLVNTDQHKCLCSIHLPAREGSAAEKGNLPIPRRRQILTTFYRNTVGTLFPAVHSPDRKDSSGTEYSSYSHSVQETYICGEDHKCYAICQDSSQFFVLFSMAVPQYAIRSVTTNLLGLLTKEKIFTDRRNIKAS